MDTNSLPNHIIDGVERRWARKLEDDVRLWMQKRGVPAMPERRSSRDAIRMSWRRDRPPKNAGSSSEIPATSVRRP